MPVSFSELFSENERNAPQANGRQYVSVGEVRTESGGCLPEVVVAYQTFGKLNSAKNNAVLICHAVSGDSNVAAWWSNVVGPGRAIDTDRFYVIGNNLLGGCQGTTGPSSAAPDGKPYGSRFPFITIGDMVEVQRRLVAVLGIEKLYCVAGGSTGGFVALEWSVRFPQMVETAFITASCARANAMQIGFHETARQAILKDPKWRGGDYPADDPPASGLAIARMLGHLTYLSPESFERKFARRLQDRDRFEFTWEPEFQVENYLRYQAQGFVKRFDANTLLHFLRALDYFDLHSLVGARAEFLFACFTSDWFYPVSQSRELHEMARTAGCKSALCVAELPFGHDCFLLDGEIQTKALRALLN